MTETQAQRLAIALPRYTSYPTVPEWSEQFSSRMHRAALEAAASRRDEPLSLYVHIPFCHRRCSYCGCNVVVSNDRTKHERYIETLALELTAVAALLGERRVLARVHYGGGTPTALDEPLLTRLWHHITAEFAIAHDAERALEIDPTVTRPEQLALLATQGFRRLSVGVQDLDRNVQSAIGRTQSFTETEAAITTAREVGFQSINIDLVYGLPRQTTASFARTIDAVLALRPDRVAVFAFAYVPDVRPNQRRLPVEDMPSATERLALRALVAERLAGAGYIAVGMDHWALPSDELALALQQRRLWRDFQGYSTHRTDETIAIGVSAISDIGGAYVQNALGLAEHRTALQIGELPTHKGLVRSAADEERRRIITQILCNLWVDLGARTEHFAPELAALAPLVNAGFVFVRGGEITVPEAGRPYLRHVASVFDEYLPRSKSGARFSSAV